MSAPTKELNTVFQNATEVTSLDSTYRLAVIGSDGDPKKVDQSVLLKGVGDFGINLVPGSLKKLVSSYITFNIPAGIPVTLSFESYEAVIGPTPTDFLVINASTIDGNGVYLNVKANESITFISAGYPRLYTSTAWTTNKGYFHKLKIEKGYSASKWTPAPEDLIALLGGGVICLLPINYANTLKGGGLRDDGDERIIQRPTERYHDRFLYVQRHSNRYGYLHPKRDFSIDTWNSQCTLDSRWMVVIRRCNHLQSCRSRNAIGSAYKCRDVLSHILGCLDALEEGSIFIAPERRAAA